MAGGPQRRPLTALLASLALVAFATLAGGAEWRVPVDTGEASTALRGAQAETALVPAKRQTGEQRPFLVLAVLAVLAGLAAAGAGYGSAAADAIARPAAHARTARPRGPPILRFS